MKKGIAMTMAAALTLSLTVSGSTIGFAQTVKAEETSQLLPKLVMALDVDPADLSPNMSNALGSSMINWYCNVFETLFDYDEDNNLVPNLASGYEELSGDVYRVYLYDSIHDSAGNPITADDVIFSYQNAIDSGDLLKYDIFDHIEKVDDYTLDFYWNTDDFAAGMLEFPFCRTFVFSQAAFESSNFATAPIGTGNYTVQEFVAGSKVVLEYDENYWALDPEVKEQRLAHHYGNVQELELDVIPDAATAIVGLEKGDIDVCTYVQTEMIGEFDEGGSLDEEYNVIKSATSDYMMLQPNMKSSILGEDLNLRLAIFYGIDNQAIAQMMGGGYLALNAFGVSYYSAYDPAWEEEATYVNTYDLELAKEYLAKSNYNGESINLMIPSGDAQKNGATMIQSMLLQLGINVEINAYSQTEFDTHTGEEDAWDMRFATTGGPNLIGSFNPMFGLDFYVEGYTTGFLADPELNELYEAAKYTDSSEDDKKVIDYALENAYVDTIAGIASTIIVPSSLTEEVYSEGHFIPAACTYNVQ